MSSVLFALGPAVAAYAQAPSLYFGGSWGQYDIEENAFDETDTLWKAFIGTELNHWFGLEAAFVNFDRAREQNSSYEADGWTGAAAVSIPFGGNSALYAKGGAFWWEAQSNFPGVRRDEDGTDPFWGAGLRFGIAEPLSLRVEYERYEVDSIDLDSVSVGLQANF